MTLPDQDDELWIMEGVNGLMIAADVFGDGHYTEYPSHKPSVALQLPFKDGVLPQHRVVSQGVCKPGTEPGEVSNTKGAGVEQLPLAPEEDFHDNCLRTLRISHHHRRGSSRFLSIACPSRTLLIFA